MRRQNRRKLLLGTLRAVLIAPAPIRWLFRDDFSIDDAAPLTDPLPADDEGSWVVTTDTGNNLDVAGSRLQINGRVAAADPRLSSSVSYARAAGLALFMRVITPPAADMPSRFGFDDAASGQINYSTIQLNDDGRIFARMDAVLTEIGISTDLSDDVLYDFVFILRATGIFIFCKGGTQYPAWTLLWVESTLANTPLWFAVTPAASAGTMGLFFETTRLVQLAKLWAENDFAIATQRLAGARSPGDTFTHAPDCFIEFTVTTVPSALQIELWFRIQDATNRWLVSVDSAGDLDLDEVVAGVPTQRGTAAGVIVDADRVAVRAIGAEIAVFDSVLRITYSSATNFQAETDGELDTEGTGGAVADIVSWEIFGQNFNKYVLGA